ARGLAPRPRRIFPFRLGRQPHSQYSTITLGIVPAHHLNRQLFALEAARIRTCHSLVGLLCYQSLRDPETFSDGHVVPWLLIIEAFVVPRRTTHREPASWYPYVIQPVVWV